MRKRRNIVCKGTKNTCTNSKVETGSKHRRRFVARIGGGKQIVGPWIASRFRHLCAYLVLNHVLFFSCDSFCSVHLSHLPWLFFFPFKFQYIVTFEPKVQFIFHLDIRVSCEEGVETRPPLEYVLKSFKNFTKVQPLKLDRHE